MLYHYIPARQYRRYPYSRAVYRVLSAWAAGFDVLASQVVARQGATRRDLCGRTVTRARSGHSRCLGLCRPVTRWTPRGGNLGCRRGRLHLSRRRTGPGDVGPGAPWRAAGQGAREFAGPPRYRCSIRRSSRSARPMSSLGTHALCVRFDRNGFPQSAERSAPTRLIRVRFSRRRSLRRRPLHRFIGIAATRRWCCAWAGWFISGSPSHGGSTALVSLSSASLGELPRNRELQRDSSLQALVEALARRAGRHGATRQESLARR